MFLEIKEEYKAEIIDPNNERLEINSQAQSNLIKTLSEVLDENHGIDFYKGLIESINEYSKLNKNIDIYEIIVELEQEIVNQSKISAPEQNAGKLDGVFLNLENETLLDAKENPINKFIENEYENTVDMFIAKKEDIKENGYKKVTWSKKKPFNDYAVLQVGEEEIRVAANLYESVNHILGQLNEEYKENNNKLISDMVADFERTYYKIDGLTLGEQERNLTDAIENGIFVKKPEYNYYYKFFIDQLAKTSYFVQEKLESYLDNAIKNDKIYKYYPLKDITTGQYEGFEVIMNKEDNAGEDNVVKTPEELIDLAIKYSLEEVYQKPDGYMIEGTEYENRYNILEFGELMSVESSYELLDILLYNNSMSLILSEDNEKQFEKEFKNQKLIDNFSKSTVNKYKIMEQINLKKGYNQQLQIISELQKNSNLSFEDIQETFILSTDQIISVTNDIEEISDIIHVVVNDDTKEYEIKYDASYYESHEVVKKSLKNDLISSEIDKNYLSKQGIISSYINGNYRIGEDLLIDEIYNQINKEYLKKELIVSGENGEIWDDIENTILDIMLKEEDIVLSEDEYDKWISDRSELNKISEKIHQRLMREVNYDINNKIDKYMENTISEDNLNSKSTGYMEFPKYYPVELITSNLERWYLNKTGKIIANGMYSQSLESRLISDVDKNEYDLTKDYIELQPISLKEYKELSGYVDEYKSKGSFDPSEKISNIFNENVIRDYISIEKIIIGKDKIAKYLYKSIESNQMSNSIDIEDFLVEYCNENPDLENNKILEELTRTIVKRSNGVFWSSGEDILLDTTKLVHHKVLNDYLINNENFNFEKSLNEANEYYKNWHVDELSKNETIDQYLSTTIEDIYIPKYIYERQFDEALSKFKIGNILVEEYETLKSEKRVDSILENYNNDIFDGSKFANVSGISETNDEIIVKRDSGNPFNWDMKVIPKDLSKENLKLVSRPIEYDEDEISKELFVDIKYDFSEKNYKMLWNKQKEEYKNFTLSKAEIILINDNNEVVDTLRGDHLNYEKMPPFREWYIDKDYQNENSSIGQILIDKTQKYQEDILELSIDRFENILEEEKLVDKILNTIDKEDYLKVKNSITGEGHWQYVEDKLFDYLKDEQLDKFINYDNENIEDKFIDYLFSSDKLNDFIDKVHKKLDTEENVMKEESKEAIYLEFIESHNSREHVEKWINNPLTQENLEEFKEDLIKHSSDKDMGYYKAYIEKTNTNGEVIKNARFDLNNERFETLRLIEYVEENMPQNNIESEINESNINMVNFMYGKEKVNIDLTNIVNSEEFKIYESKALNLKEHLKGNLEDVLAYYLDEIKTSTSYESNKQEIISYFEENNSEKLEVNLTEKITLLNNKELEIIDRTVGINPLELENIFKEAYKVQKYSDYLKENLNVEKVELEKDYMTADYYEYKYIIKKEDGTTKEYTDFEINDLAKVNKDIIDENIDQQGNYIDGGYEKSAFLNEITKNISNFEKGEKLVVSNTEELVPFEMKKALNSVSGIVSKEFSQKYYDLYLDEEVKKSKDKNQNQDQEMKQSTSLKM